MFISKRSNRFYYLFYFDESGKRHKVSTGSKTRSDALKFLQKFDPQASDKDRAVEHISLTDFTRAYLEYASTRHSPKYTESIRTSLRRFIAAVGDMPLDVLSRWDSILRFTFTA